jgi:hypothetical protein
MLVKELTARNDSFSLQIKRLDEKALKTSLVLEFLTNSASRVFFRIVIN